MSFTHDDQAAAVDTADLWTAEQATGDANLRAEFDFIALGPEIVSKTTAAI